MLMTDLPKKIPGLGACAACVAAKSVHFPHKEGRNRAGAYLDRVHIDIAGPNTHGPRNRLVERNMSISVSMNSRAVYTRPLRLRPNAPEAFKISKRDLVIFGQRPTVARVSSRSTTIRRDAQTCLRPTIDRVAKAEETRLRNCNGREGGSETNRHWLPVGGGQF